MVAVTYGSGRVAADASAEKARAGDRKGFFARLLGAMMEARMQQAYRELSLHQHLVWQREIEPVETRELPFGR
jgi:hypothetical protein